MVTKKLREREMKILDLFSGAGGAAMGLHRAFPEAEITGVDIRPQPRYPFNFVQADALEFPLDGYDFIWASPPCQAFSIAAKNKDKIYPDCLTPIRSRLKKWGGMWVIENVVGAPMEPYTIQLCGLMFDLPIFRHRLFQISHWIGAPLHPSHKGKRIGEGYYSIAGSPGKWRFWGKGNRTEVSKGSLHEWRSALDIDWMTSKELTQAVPPAYSEFIGRQLRNIIGRQYATG